jgi:hypothetical protein
MGGVCVGAVIGRGRVGCSMMVCGDFGVVIRVEDRACTPGAEMLERIIGTGNLN